MKLNCWEFKKCGREPGGVHEHDLGVCPVAKELRLDGTHGGRAAGRLCWVVAGSLCGGQVQGTFAKKFESCEKCDFYAMVREEEFLASSTRAPWHMEIADAVTKDGWILGRRMLKSFKSCAVYVPPATWLMM